MITNGLMITNMKKHEFLSPRRSANEVFFIQFYPVNGDQNFVPRGGII
jgi:hypothetical protein